MSRSGQHFWIWVFVAVLIGGGALGLRLAGRTSQPRPAPGGGFSETLPPNVTLRLRNVGITGRSNGVPSWKLRAGLVDTTRGQTEVTFTEGIKAEFLQNGKTAAKVTAPTAVYKVNAKEVEASGGVLCRIGGTAGRDELKIETPRVAWSIGARQITCPAQVTVTRRQAELSGENLIVDLVTRDYSLQNAKARFIVDEDSDPGQILDVVPSTP